MKINGPTEKPHILLDKQPRRFRSVKAVIDRDPGVTAYRKGGNVRTSRPRASAERAHGRSAEANNLIWDYLIWEKTGDNASYGHKRPAKER